MKKRSSKKPDGGLPAHWKRRRTFTALAIFAACALFSVLFAPRQHAETSDALWLRARFSLRERWQSNAAPDPQIVLIELDDKTADAWREPLIAWGPHFAQVLDAVMVRGGARVLALDWIQPISTEQWFPGNDEKLKLALSRAKNVVLVEELRSGKNGGAPTWIRPTPELLYALPDSFSQPNAHLGYAEFSEKNSVVAALKIALPAEENGAPPTLGFAARTVQRSLKKPARVLAKRFAVSEKLSVPLRNDGTLLVNFRSGSGTPRAFTRHSMSDAAAMTQAQARAAFQNKIVLLGETRRGSNDSHFVPFFASDFSGTRLISGVELHANIVRTLLDARPISEPSSMQTALLSLLLAALALLAFCALRFAHATLLCIGAALCWLALSLLLFVYFDFALPAFLPLLNLVLAGALMGVYRALGEERERAQVMQVWGRYQDARVVEYALQNPQVRGGEGLEMHAVVLFADLKNFTKTVEHLAPADALHHLNRYLALISDAVLQHGGLVDKYLGDGLMAQWGAPQPRENGAADAVRACLKMQKRARVLAADSENQIAFGLRLTLHCGAVVAGNVGAESRLEFTVIGDTVNVTARLQETAKAMNCDFLVSENIYLEVENWVDVGQRGEIEIRGRNQPLRVFEIVGENDASTAAGSLETS